MNLSDLSDDGEVKLAIGLLDGELETESLHSVRDVREEVGPPGHDACNRRNNTLGGGSLSGNRVRHTATDTLEDLPSNDLSACRGSLNFGMDSVAAQAIDDAYMADLGLLSFWSSSDESDGSRTPRAPSLASSSRYQESRTQTETPRRDGGGSQCRARRTSLCRVSCGVRGAVSPSDSILSSFYFTFYTDMIELLNYNSQLPR